MSTAIPTRPASGWPAAFPGSPLLAAGLALAATAAAVAFWKWPQWGLAALGFALLLGLLFRFPCHFVYLYLGIDLLPASALKFLDESTLSGGAGHGGNVIGLAWLLSLIVFSVYTLRKQKRWWRLSWYRPSFLLISLALAGALRAEDRGFGVRDWVHLAAPICLSLVLYANLSSWEQALAAIRRLCLIFAIAMAAGFYQLASGTGSYDFVTKSYRLTGNYGDGGEVGYAVLLLYLACFAAPMALARSAPIRFVSTTVAAASIFLLLASQARGPLLAFLCASGTLLCKSVVKARYGLLLLALALATAQFVPRVYSRFGGPLLSAPTRFWEDDGISANATQRMATWSMLYLEFADRSTLLAGRGFGFSDNYLANQLDDPHDAYAHAVHDEYLRLLIDLGFLGPVLLLAQMAALFRAGVRLSRRARDPLARSLGTSLCAMTVALGVTATTSNIFGAAAQYDVFWILAGVLLSAFRWDPAWAAAAPHLIEPHRPFANKIAAQPQPGMP